MCVKAVLLSVVKFVRAGSKTVGVASVIAKLIDFCCLLIDFFMLLIPPSFFCSMKSKLIFYAADSRISFVMHEVKASLRRLGNSLTVINWQLSGQYGQLSGQYE